MLEETQEPKIYFSYTDEFGYTTSANMDLPMLDNSNPANELAYSFSRFMLLCGFHQDTIAKYINTDS